jgi:hypothetical protein
MEMHLRSLKGVQLALLRAAWAQHVGMGNTKLYEQINEGSIETITVGRRRLAVYASLERLAASAKTSHREESSHG